jgi:hypothetical protein
VGVAELAVGVGLGVVGLEEVGAVVTVAVAVAVTRAVSVAVAVVVVVAVTTGVGVTDTLTTGEGGVEAPEGGLVDALVDGATDGLTDRVGTPDPLAVGRLTAGPVAVRLGGAGVDDGRGRPLPLTFDEPDGRVTEPLGAIGGFTVCPQPARTSPATVTTDALRTPPIVCSSRQREVISPSGCTFVRGEVAVVTRLE